MFIVAVFPVRRNRTS